LRVAILAYTFPRGMGYIGNMLPRYLARLGADVHYITMDLPHYFQNTDRINSYGTFDGLDIMKPGAVEAYDGFTLHGLGHSSSLGQMKFVGLEQKLRELRVDVVQSLLAIGWPPLQAARMRRKFGFSLFTANHTTASVFPLAQQVSRMFSPARIKNFFTRFTPGRYISRESVKCYAATVDCAQVAVDFFGVEREKIELAPLGVDTDLFWPIRTDADRADRSGLRGELGVSEQEVLFIYTGQFTDSKNPILLADAIQDMAGRGLPVRALFVGDGAQASGIAARKNTIVRPFMPNISLPRFYRAADVGVWPTQESTSMLDAAACGLPVVVNDTLRAVERIDGNGLQYRLNDVGDLVRVLSTLLDAPRRVQLGSRGAMRMEREFSWRDLATRRLVDYEASLRRAPLP
jgi:glycosyltransferase involved in cell wall biosynthesis